MVLGFWMVCSVQRRAMNDHCATTTRIEKFQCCFYFVFADPFQMVIMVASRIKDARKKVGAKFSPPTSNKKQFHCKCLQGPQFLLCIYYIRFTQKQSELKVCREAFYSGCCPDFWWEVKLKTKSSLFCDFPRDEAFIVIIAHFSAHSIEVAS